MPVQQEIDRHYNPWVAWCYTSPSLHPFVGLSDYFEKFDPVSELNMICLTFYLYTEVH